MQEIGGYFNLELKKYNNCPNFEGKLLNMGRNAFEYILRSIMPIKHIWIPYYTCHTVIEPINKLNIPFSFYHINNNLEIKDVSIFLDKDSYVLCTNYFGVKDKYIDSLCKLYPEQVIVDASQALFYPHFKKSFYSPWKFVGIPDGGIAFSDSQYNFEFEQDISYNKFTHLLKRIDLSAEDGYSDFRLNIDNLHNNPIKNMSKLTKTLIESIDFENVKRKRISNFNFLNQRLELLNKLNLNSLTFECPMVYPFLISDLSLRQKLIDNKVFVATYWPNVFEWCNEDDLDYVYSKYILPLPIDQRYGEKEMNKIINLILE